MLHDKINQRARSLVIAPIAIAVAGLLACTSANAQTGGEPPAAQEAPGKLTVVEVRPNVHVITGAGGNVTVQSGADGLLLVDTGSEGASDAVLAAIRTISKNPIRFIVTTHFDPEHTGGNAAIAKAGSAVAGGGGASSVSDADATAAILAHENVLMAVSSLDNPPPFEGWPTSTYFTNSKHIFFNGEGVELIHPKGGHSRGDSIVYLRKSDVVVAGDIYTPTQYPVIDPASGGSLQGTIDALNDILDMLIPEQMQEGGTLVVPGHGRVGDVSDVVEYRDMLTIIRNYIQEMIKEGKSLDQIQKARPTFGFDPLYGRETGPWTTKMFVEAVYRELRSKKGRG